MYGWSSRSETSTKTVEVIEIREINKEIRFSIKWFGRRGDAQFEEQLREHRPGPRLIPGPPSSAPPSTTK